MFLDMLWIFLRIFLLKSDESREIFRQSLLSSGEFTHVSFKLYTEQINGVDTHSICITAFTNVPNV